MAGGEKVFPTHIVAAGALVQNEKGEVLLVRNRNGAWTWTGGQVEVGETLMEAAQREVMEESGVACRVERLFAVEQLSKI